METLVHINTQRIYTLENANKILPLVYKITEDSFQMMKHQNNRQAALKGEQNSPLYKEIEAEKNFILSKWNNKLERLGIHPNGLWVADFDTGEGYLCWKFPEVELKYFHGYQDGFCGRTLIK